MRLHRVQRLGIPGFSVNNEGLFSKLLGERVQQRRMASFHLMQQRGKQVDVFMFGQ